MTPTDFAVKLIEQYREQDNRLRRAEYAKRLASNSNDWRMKAYDAKISPYFEEKSRLNRKQALNVFLDGDYLPTRSLFVSAAVKAGYKRHLKAQIKRLESDPYASQKWRISEFKEELDELDSRPVRADLAKLWRAVVNAHFDREEAYKERWQARCAIYAFNTMNLGLKIKFGNMANGPMSRVCYIEVDGFDVKLKTFLENAEFESVILKG